MATIIAARFSLQAEVQQAMETLQQAGAPASRIASFYVNPPGQHDIYPVGGDRDESPGAEKVDKGSISGIGAGGVAGAAAGSVAGPPGAIVGGLVGAHVGSLIGSLSRTDENINIPPIRQAGMLVAVAVSTPDEEQQMIGALRQAGGTCLERAQGQIVNGDWNDFDPLSTPAFIDPQT